MRNPVNADSLSKRGGLDPWTKVSLERWVLLRGNDESYKNTLDFIGLDIFTHLKYFQKNSALKLLESFIHYSVASLENIPLDMLTHAAP